MTAIDVTPIITGLVTVIAVLVLLIKSILDNRKNHQGSENSPMAFKSDVDDVHGKINRQVETCTERFLEISEERGKVDANIVTIKNTLESQDKKLDQILRNGKKK